MDKSIIVISMPIHSGKTTLLKKWIQGKNNVKGFLSPDKAGKRVIMHLTTNNILDFETSSDDLEAKHIGKYYFKQSVFNLIKSEMNDYNSQEDSWYIVDEIGPLEINRNDGFEPAFGSLVQRFKTQSPTAKLIVVVRSHLLFDFIEKYQLKNEAQFFNRSFFLLYGE